MDLQDSAKKEEIKKIEPTTKEEDNVIKLDASKKEPKIFDEKPKQETQEEKPLVLSDEVAEEKPTKQNKENQTLSPAVRKIVVENKIDINSVKGSGKDGRVLKGDLIKLNGNQSPTFRKKS